MSTNTTNANSSADIESTYAWIRLCVALVVGTVGCIGSWFFVVALPFATWICCSAYVRSWPIAADFCSAAFRLQSEGNRTHAPL